MIRPEVIAYNKMRSEQKRHSMTPWAGTNVGGLWKSDSGMNFLVDLTYNELGRVAEFLFEDEFGYSSRKGPLDIPELNADIKVAKRAKRKVQFTVHIFSQWKAARDGLIEDINKIIYVVYLIFPEYFEIVYIPHAHLKMLCPKRILDEKFMISINMYHTLKEKYDFRKYFPNWDLLNIETVTALPEMGSLEEFL